MPQIHLGLKRTTLTQDKGVTQQANNLGDPFGPSRSKWILRRCSRRRPHALIEASRWVASSRFNSADSGASDRGVERCLCSRPRDQGVPQGVKARTHYSERGRAVASPWCRGLSR